MRSFGSIVKEKSIPWVRHWIDASYDFSKNFVDPETGRIDFEALGKEEWEFRKALHDKNFENNERAKFLWDEAVKIHKKNKENGQKGGRPSSKNTQAKNNDQVTASDISANGSQLDAASGNAADDCKAPPSSTTLVADGETREGSLNFTTPQGAHLESGTSATTENSPAEAPTGNEGDELAMPEGGSLLNSDGLLLESATSAGQQNSVRGSAKPACGQVATGRKQLPPPTKEAVYDFARTAKLDADDAREWFEINFVDRPGCDKDGVVIKNWKGHCKNYCRAKAKRRKEED